MSPASKKKAVAKKSVKKSTTKKSATSTKKASTKKAPAKKASKKKAASAKKAPAKKLTKKLTKASSLDITPEERWKMVAIAAYHKAEKRDFAPGHELQDWIDSENEIDAILQG